jgi:hypothetical protein
MFPTVEVRWFDRGQTPPGVQAWFHQGERRVDRRPPRVDHYLRITDPGALSVKFREGRIEVKRRVLRRDAMRFHQRVTGIVEHWRKWSFELANAPRARAGVGTPAGAWIPVRKERRLITYRLTGGRHVVPVATPSLHSDARDQRCVMELTGVVVGKQDWWTLAFEAFGDESGLEDVLLDVARAVLRAREPPVLNAPESLGYADWLRTAAEDDDAV